MIERIVRVPKVTLKQTILIIRMAFIFRTFFIDIKKVLVSHCVIYGHVETLAHCFI